MTITAFDDQFTAAPELVRQPYDTVSILKQNVADLELALRTQTELKEKAEAELANLAKQEPVAYVKYKTTGGNVGLAWMAIPTAAFYPREGEKLYVTPVPVPHKGATHCDGCGMTWLDDGLNPLGCPYCKDTVPAPAVPELDPMTRLIVSDPKQLKPKKQEPAVPDGWTEWNGGTEPPVLSGDQRNYEFLRRDGQLAAYVSCWQHGIGGTGKRDIVAYRRKPHALDDALLQSAEVKK